MVCCTSTSPQKIGQIAQLTEPQLLEIMGLLPKQIIQELRSRCEAGGGITDRITSLDLSISEPDKSLVPTLKDFLQEKYPEIAKQALEYLKKKSAVDQVFDVAWSGMNVNLEFQATRTLKASNTETTFLLVGRNGELVKTFWIAEDGKLLGMLFKGRDYNNRLTFDHHYQPNQAFVVALMVKLYSMAQEEASKSVRSSQEPVALPS